MAEPGVSVIIPTYNWSAALACALQSVLAQTRQDFEVIVIGDGCTDDSAAVVASFGDPRLHWVNLPQNTGNQSAPNNLGISLARGERIAYLGHDDIWRPRHLEATLAAAEMRGALASVGGLLMFGPRGSGLARVAGLPLYGSLVESDFVPPSALVHRRSLIETIGGWGEADALRLPIDCDLFRRIFAATTIAVTGEITVFKFNATSRRNSYQRKDITDQRRVLAGLARGPEFVAELLTEALASAAEGKFAKIEMPQEQEPGEIGRANRIARGVEPRFPVGQLRPCLTLERYTLEHEPHGAEWHDVERDAEGETFRWSGPGEESPIELPILYDRALHIRIRILQAMADDGLSRLRLTLNGEPVTLEVDPAERGWVVAAIAPGPGPSTPVPYLQVLLSGTPLFRPVDLGLNRDERRLGVCVAWIEVSPAAAGVACGVAPLDRSYGPTVEAGS